jgi:hypothetical protein
VVGSHVLILVEYQAIGPDLPCGYLTHTFYFFLLCSVKRAWTTDSEMARKRADKLFMGFAVVVNDRMMLTVSYFSADDALLPHQKKKQILHTVDPGSPSCPHLFI